MVKRGGLLNIEFTDGTSLVAGKRVTGFAWSEEVVAGVARLSHMPLALLRSLLHCISHQEASTHQEEGQNGGFPGFSIHTAGGGKGTGIEPSP